MSEQATGSSAAIASITGMPKPSNIEGKHQRFRVFEQRRQHRPRRPPNHVNTLPKTAGLDPIHDRVPGLARQPRDDQMFVEALRDKLAVGLEQSFPVLVRIERRDRKQISSIRNLRFREKVFSVGRIFLEAEKTLLNPVWNHTDSILGNPVHMRQLGLDVLRRRHQAVGRPDSAPNREVPSLPFDPPEVSRKALVLQVMNHRQLPRRRRQGRGKPRREDDIQSPREPLQRKNRLLPQQPQWTNARRDDASHRAKVLRLRRKVAAGLAIRENVVEVFVGQSRPTPRADCEDRSPSRQRRPESGKGR